MPLVYPSANPGLLPQGGRTYKIDWSNPLTRGLEICYLPGIAGGVNITKKGLNLTMTNASSGMTREGPAMVTTDIAGQAPSSAAIPTTHPLVTTSSSTVYWRGLYTAWGTVPNGFFGVAYDNLDSAPYMVYGLVKMSTANIFEAYSNSNGVDVSSGFGTAASANTVLSVAATFVASGGTVSGYLNGLATGTPAAIASTLKSTATSYIVLGGEAASHITPATANIACIWTRALSASEIAAYDKNPYQFILIDQPQTPIYHPGFWWMAENNMEAAMRNPNKNYLRR